MTRRFPRFRDLLMLLALSALAAPASGGSGLPVTHMTPPPQPPLELINGRDLAPVRNLFNHEADRPRILVLLSPT
jgi:hypothetical protein